MNKILDAGYWGRALSHPLVLVGLFVDLLPIYAVLAWGWNAVPLVMLYWMENVIAGAMTIPRLVVSGARFGPFGLIGGALLSAFFVVHYGLFCLVHGTFLVVFAGYSDPQSMNDAPVMDLFGMFAFGMNSGLHVDWMIYAIVAFQLLVFLVEFLWKGEWRRTTPDKEMMAPYGRIVVLHFGIFAGAAALFLLGQPMVGVLALILFRAVWGVRSNSRRFGAEADNGASSSPFETAAEQKANAR